MQLLSVLAVLTLLAQAPGALFEIELWPGEGRPQFQAMTNELVLRETPSTVAPIARRLPVRTGSAITFDESLYRTLEAGRVEVVAKTTLTGRLLGATRHVTSDVYYKGEFPVSTLDFAVGTSINYLQFRAEGTCFIEVTGQVMDVDPCPTEDDGIFRFTRQPKTEWWIRVVQDGKPVGWVMVDEKIIKEGDRQF